MKYSTLYICVVAFVLLSNASLAQWQNPTTWPYGGMPDSSRKKGDMVRSLNFSEADFSDAAFDSLADFDNSMFAEPANYNNAKFNGVAYFPFAHFKNKAEFIGAEFKGWAEFGRAQFDSMAYFFSTPGEFSDALIFDILKRHNFENFNDTRFESLAVFSLAEFHNIALFGNVKFDSMAYFTMVKFFSEVDFFSAEFKNNTFFTHSHFSGSANFENVKFYGLTDFGGATFDSNAIFRDVNSTEGIISNGATFNNKIDLRDASVGGLIDFSLATLKDTLLIGEQKSGNIQKHDLRLTKLRISSNKGAKIILYGPVDLSIQSEKFRFVKICDTLDYYAKKDIVAVLKNNESLKGNKTAQFELDYLFAKSTMYQKVSGIYEMYSAFHPYAWWQFLYNATMGLGYRPFRLIWWVLGLILSFGVYYIIRLSDRIDAYIMKEVEQKKSSAAMEKTGQENKYTLADKIQKCLYFSTMVLFTFRLKKDILTFFTIQERKVIVTQWRLGFLIYVAFLTLSKAGSILQNLKDLFIG